MELGVGVCMISEIVDNGIGVVGSLVLVDDTSPCVTFNFEIVVPCDGVFVSLISVMVV